MSEYQSWFWYWRKWCLQAYHRPGRYISLGFHIGNDAELHFINDIWILTSREKGKELEEADKYYLEGIEPDG